MATDDLLSQVPLLRGLDAATRARIAAHVVERRLRPGELLFHEGEPGAALYAVAEGEVEVLVKSGAEELTLARVGPGGHLGEMAVLDDAPRSATARAATPALLLEVPREVVLEELLSSPATARALLAEMARRLRAADALAGEHVARDPVREMEERLTVGERLADRFTSFNGSWAFILGVLGVTAAWVVANEVLHRPFDAFPYVLFNLVLGIGVALQGPFIMMSQNRQARKDRARAAADYEVNLKNELGIQALARDLARLERKLDALAGRPGA